MNKMHKALVTIWTDDSKKILKEALDYMTSYDYLHFGLHY